MNKEANDSYQREVREILTQAERLQREGRLDGATQLYRRLLSIAIEQEGGQEEIIFALLRLGDIYLEGGQESLAFECYRDAEERSLGIDFQEGVLDCTQRRGAAHLIAGRWVEAAKAAKEGRDLARRLELRSFEAVFLGLLGQVERRMGNHESALNCAFEGLQVSQMLGNLDEELTFLADMALISLGKGDYEGAKRQAESGIRRAKEAVKPERLAVFLGQKCHALRGCGEIDAARACAKEGLELAVDNGDKKEEATFRHDLALFCQESGDIDGARKHSLEAYKAFLSMGNKEGALTSLRCLTMVFAEMGDWEGSVKGLIDALVLAASMEQRLFLGTFLDLKSIVAHFWRQGRFDDANSVLAHMKQFFGDLEKELDASPSKDNYLHYLRLSVEVLSEFVSSKGRDKDGSDALEGVIEKAKEVDSTIDMGLEDFILELCDGRDSLL